MNQAKYSTKKDENMIDSFRQTRSHWWQHEFVPPIIATIIAFFCCAFFSANSSVIERLLTSLRHNIGSGDWLMLCSVLSLSQASDLKRINGLLRSAHKASLVGTKWTNRYVELMGRLRQVSLTYVVIAGIAFVVARQISLQAMLKPTQLQTADFGVMAFSALVLCGLLLLGQQIDLAIGPCLQTLKARHKKRMTAAVSTKKRKG